jgi:hypothetical protein
MATTKRSKKGKNESRQEADEIREELASGADVIAAQGEEGKLS